MCVQSTCSFTVSPIKWEQWHYVKNVLQPPPGGYTQHSICKLHWPKNIYMYVCVYIYISLYNIYLKKILLKIRHLNIPYLRTLGVTDDMMTSIMTSWQLITEQCMNTWWVVLVNMPPGPELSCLFKWIHILHVYSKVMLRVATPEWSCHDKQRWGLVLHLHKWLMQDTVMVMYLQML